MIRSLGIILFYYLYKLEKINRIFYKYHAYEENRIKTWLKRNSIKLSILIKIIKNIQFYDAVKIRHMFSEYINNNKHIFDQNDVYVCCFGNFGKSGAMLLYDFNNCSEFSFNMIEKSNIPSLPDNSTIIFVDDIIGTGKQSVSFITDTLMPLSNASHKFILLTVLGTNDGINLVKENTGVDVYAVKVLIDEDDQYSPSCKTWTDKEREILIKSNDKLKTNRNDYDKGLLVAFHYSVPNNTIPLIWKNNYKYKINNKESIHYALLPRDY